MLAGPVCALQIASLICHCLQLLMIHSVQFNILSVLFVCHVCACYLCSPEEGILFIAVKVMDG